MMRGTSMVRGISWARCLCGVLTMLMLGACARSGGIPSSPDALGVEVPDFDIPQPQRWTLENGLEVYYYHNPELPLMRATLYVHGGGAYDSFGIPGLASATGSQMREGGTVGYTPDELDEYLDKIAASIESSVGDEYSTVSLFCLSEDFQELFPLYSSIVRQPAFAPERLALWKALSLEAIRRRSDNPGTISSLVFAELLYGRGSKLAEITTPASIAAISPLKMRAFHSAFFAPQRARLAISGSLAQDEVQAAIERAFGDWQASGALAPLTEPQLGVAAQPGIYVVSRPLDQATVTIGHLGPPRHTDDAYAIEVFSEIFGSSGFSSVLFQEIRTKRGLAYSVYGGVFPGFVAGTYQIGLQTKKDEAAAAVKASIGLAAEATRDEPAPVLFEEAKTAVERSFVFKFAKPESIVDRAAMLEMLGYPKDYDEKYLERIDAVDRSEARAAAARWIDPARTMVLIVGDVSVDALKDAFPDAPIYQVEFDTAPGAIRQLN